MSNGDGERFLVGQLVRLRSIFAISTHVDVWEEQPFLSSMFQPIRKIDDGAFAVVLGADINCYRVFVDGTIGWVDKHDVESL
jgi:hypothetical protein